MLEEWLFIAFAGVVLIFVYSKMVYFSSLYAKVNEEYQSTLSRNKSLESLLKRYEDQVDSSLGSIHELQTTIKELRIELKETASDNKRLQKDIIEYQSKVEFLFSQIEKTA